METRNRQYKTPSIEKIMLDNEISLILVSGDPGDPFAEMGKKSAEYYNQAPFDPVQI